MSQDHVWKVCKCEEAKVVLFLDQPGAPSLSSRKGPHESQRRQMGRGNGLKEETTGCKACTGAGETTRLCPMLIGERVSTPV